MNIQRYKIEDRWSPAVVESGWSAVPNLFLNSYAQLGLSAAEAMLIVHIFSYKWDDERPFPSVGMLARRLGLSSSRVRAMLKKVEDKGYIRRCKRVGRSNEYEVEGLIKALEHLNIVGEVPEQDEPDREAAMVSELPF